MSPNQTSRCIGWCFTLNNPTDEEEHVLTERLSDESLCRYAVFQKESGENGTPHYQGYVEFKIKQRFAAVKTKLGLDRLHVERRNGTREQARDYCMKEESRLESPCEFGIWREAGKSTELSALLKSLKDGETLNSVASEFPSTYVRNYKGIAVWKALVVSKSELKPNTRGIWIYGPPGLGKSRYVHEKYTDLYLKAQNKWWDGYDGQTTVLLDDLDEQGACLSHYLKIWTDHYPCSGEIKGGTVKLNHDHFIVTSNYTPIDLWPDAKNATLREAIKRRFTLLEFNNNNELEETEWPDYS